MMKLITTENFGDLACDFYRNSNDEILLTREQIGRALNYSDPSLAIRKIHIKHKDRLDNLCVRVKSKTIIQNDLDIDSSTSTKLGLVGNDNLQTERVYYTERGIMEICRWSRQPNANIFMDWAWDIIEQYRNHELVDYKTVISLVQQSLNANKEIKKTLDSLQNIQQTLQDINTYIQKLSDKSNTNISSSQSQENTDSSNLQNTSTRRKYKKPYNTWYHKMDPKFKLLEEYFSVTRGSLYRNILLELENTYGLNTTQIQIDYCYEHNIDSCYPLEPYEFVPEYRNMIETIVNQAILQNNLATDDDLIATTNHITIFNTVA